MPDEDRQNFASNNPYGDAYRSRWSQEARAGQTSLGSGLIDPELAQQIMAAEAARYLGQTPPPQTDPVQPGSAQQGPTAPPAYRSMAGAGEVPSDTWVAAYGQEAQEQLREGSEERGRTPASERSDPWDYQTMDPAQAAFAAAAAETWGQPPAPAQSSAHSQSHQGDQPPAYSEDDSQGHREGHQQPQVQGYAGDTTLSPEQAAYFFQQMAWPQAHSAHTPPADEATRAAISAGGFQPARPNVAQPQAHPEAGGPSLNQAQGQYPSNQFQNPATRAVTHPGTRLPVNPVAGPVNDSMAQFNPHAAMTAPLRDSEGPRLSRSGAVRDPGTGRGGRARRGRGG